MNIQEDLSIYGSQKTFEWGFSDGDAPYLITLDREEGTRHRESRTETDVIELPNAHEKLPKELWKYTLGFKL